MAVGIALLPEGFPAGRKERVLMDNQPDGGAPPSDKGRPRPRTNPLTFWPLILLVVLVSMYVFNGNSAKESEINYGLFREELSRDNIAKVTVKGMKIYGDFKSPPELPRGKTEGEKVTLSKKFVTVVPPYVLDDREFDAVLRQKLGENYAATEPGDNTGVVVSTYLVGTLILLVGAWFLFRRARDQMLGGGFLSSFSKSPARRYEANDKRITFNDVAGLENVKSELEEVVEFLKSPEKFQRLGGRIPKGILLMGPPGTGKTLLGRAVAGEAGVPFFSISGSEFIQMFVGVGASRVRDLFNTAKENAPSILFIDEIDAVGRHRGTGLGGGHDEREQTLNQILSEMDGFTPSETVIVMAATNRPDVLDPALLRPGRFDRHITVDRPSLKGRRAIFEVHTKQVPLAPDVDLNCLAAGTIGLTGADIRSLVNEAALWATRHGKDHVEMSDFEHARDKVLMGPKRDEVLTAKDKAIIAYHESGHALAGWFLPCGDRVHKISIIPHGRALGVTQIVPEEDRFNISEHELRAQLAVSLGGRAAERLVYGQCTVGSENDLKRATHLARRMVTQWGMSERLGPVAYRDGEEHPFLGKEMAEPREFSEHTAQLIDEEVVQLLRDAAEQIDQLLVTHRDKLDTLVATLIREEVLDRHQIEDLIGPPAYAEPVPAEPVAPEPPAAEPPPPPDDTDPDSIGIATSK